MNMYENPVKPPIFHAMKRLYPLALVVLLGACHQPAPEAKPDFLTANIDSSIKPSDVFFLFANGGWIKRTPIPASERSLGLGNRGEEKIYPRLKKVNEDACAAQNPEKGSITQKIADF